MVWRAAGLTIVGALLGLAYQRFVGCRTGGCPITSNAYLSTIYGALLGYAASVGLR
jgi:hypothetical protein